MNSRHLPHGGMIAPSQSTATMEAIWFSPAVTIPAIAACSAQNPILVGQFEFVEWTSDNHLRHSKFISLRDDLKPRDCYQGIRRLGRSGPRQTDQSVGRADWDSCLSWDEHHPKVISPSNMLQ